MNELKLTFLQNSILRVLFQHTGSELNQRQLSIKLGVSQPAVMKALPVLVELNYIYLKKDLETKRLSIILNTQNNFVTQLKRVDNLKQLYEFKLVDFLIQHCAGGTIIVFGSYSRGEDTINSDIDIAIIGRKAKQLDVQVFEIALRRKINVNFYDSFENIHKHLKENLANGIVLSGGFEL